jgi:hypothetical protein
MAIGRPAISEYNPKYRRYVDLVPESDICAALEQQLCKTVEFLNQVPAHMADYRYAPDKWTIREVVGHILDTERILGFRLLSFARGDINPLEVADQDLYVRTGGFGGYPLEAWVEQFSLIRKSNIAMVRRLPPEAWERTGTVSGLPISVRAIAYFIAGHERHHLRIIREQYLNHPIAFISGFPCIPERSP